MVRINAPKWLFGYMSVFLVNYTTIVEINCNVVFQMESLIKEMQDPDTGVPVRSQKLFLSVIPSAFMGKLYFVV